jgi:LytS/YehU family sensor histidine kinase
MITYWAIVGLSHAVLYYRESRDRAVRTAQLETQLAEAQLAALQQQLHPHFLFNTLHAISALMHKDVEAADRTLIRLGDLLRLTLENIGRHEIPLKAELDFLQKYLEIEQTRFADRLTVRFDIHPETLDARVPNLILQPLVENAIKHGVARTVGPGHIQITARRDGDKLRMEVRDNGAGLSEDGWRAIHKGIGVSTTRERLLRLFGADFRFEFHRQDPGLAVVVVVPWRLDVPAGDQAEYLGPVDRGSQGQGTLGTTAIARQHR